MGNPSGFLNSSNNNNNNNNNNNRNNNNNNNILKVKNTDIANTVNSAFNETGGTWLFISLMAKFAV